MPRVKRKGGGLLNKVINNLPFEAHLPGYNWCGPGTRVATRVARGDQGVNSLDRACRDHDLAYFESNDLAKRHAADRVLASKAEQIRKSKDTKLGEKIASWAVAKAMKFKVKKGLGHATKRTVKRATKRKKGGFIPLILPALGALGSLIAGASSVARAVTAKNADEKRLAELMRHNAKLETKSKNGKGLYLKPYVAGRGLKRRKKSSKHYQKGR